jgi:1-acyl-sn-glycerol-3-phosphate acyltransferase
MILSPETIQRAKEGVDYARDRHINQMIAAALSSAEAVNDNDGRIRGEIRRMVMKGLIYTLFDVKVEFSDRIPQQPAIIAANHLNHIDPFLLLSQLPAQPFYHILGDARTLYNKYWKRLFLHFAQGVIPLERIWKEEIAVMEAAKVGREDLTELADAIAKYVPQSNSIEMMRRLERIIQTIFTRRNGILLFPEGKLGNTEGQLLTLKRGAVIYAIRYGVPIVPVALIGTQDLYFRKKLTIRFGQSLTFPQSHRPKAGEVQAATDALQASLMDLLPQNYDEVDEPKPLRNFLNHLFW